MMPYGGRFRNQRRMVSQGFSVAKVPNYHKMQEKEAAALAHNVISNPGSLFAEVPS